MCMRRSRDRSLCLPVGRGTGCTARHAQQYTEAGWIEVRRFMDQNKSYVYVIERAEDGSFWAYLPDLPGCATTADSVEEIEGKLQEAVSLYLSYFRDRGL